MSKGFFGGDTSKAHWSVGVKRRYAGFKDLAERAGEQRRVKEAHARMRAECGQVTYYYEYPVSDDARKASQLEAAKEHAVRLQAHFGFEFDVSEGCFL